MCQNSARPGEPAGPSCKSRCGPCLVPKADYGVDFMQCCQGSVMVSINDRPDIRRVFNCFHFEYLDSRYSSTNQR